MDEPPFKDMSKPSFADMRLRPFAAMPGSTAEYSRATHRDGTADNDTQNCPPVGDAARYIDTAVQVADALFKPSRSEGHYEGDK